MTPPTVQGRVRALGWDLHKAGPRPQDPFRPEDFVRYLARGLVDGHATTAAALLRVLEAAAAAAVRDAEEREDRIRGNAR